MPGHNPPGAQGLPGLLVGLNVGATSRCNTTCHRKEKTVNRLSNFAFMVMRIIQKSLDVAWNGVRSIIPS